MRRLRRLLPVLALVAAVGFALLATGRARRLRRRALQAAARQLLRAHRGVGRARGRCARGDCREDAPRPRADARRDRVRAHRARLRGPAQGRDLRDAAAVAHRRVLHRLRPRQEPRASSPEGGTIPVRQSASVVPPDLVANIMRRPYRERFSILLSQLGQGLAGRGEDLNETIRRANPALREVNRVLRVLAQQRRTIRDLYTDADTILSQVVQRRARRGHGSSRRRATPRARMPPSRPAWTTSSVSCRPSSRELQPTLAALEGTAEAQRPALESLRVVGPPAGRAAAHHRQLLDRLAPVGAGAGRPRSQRRGQPAALAAQPQAAHQRHAPPARDRRQPRDHPQTTSTTATSPPSATAARPAAAATPGSRRSCASSGWGRRPATGSTRTPTC